MSKLPPAWQNKITRYGEQPASEFVANPNNPRRHPMKQRKAVKASLDTLGWVAPVIVNARTGYLLDGHERIWQATAQGEDTPVPFIEVDLDEAQEAQFLATFDYITYMAEYDKDTLASVIADIDSADAGIQELIADMADTLGVLREGGQEAVDPEPQTSRADELQAQWQTESGQLWLITSQDGKRTHRVLCGDSTAEADVSRLMGGKRADLLLTDPPYGVSYADKNVYLNTVAPSKRIQVPIENDHLSKQDTQALWGAVFKRCYTVMSGGASFYCFMPQGGDQMMMMMEAGIEPRHELIWLKNNHVLGRVDYAYKHEPIAYGWKEGGHKFYGGFQTSILEFDKPHKSDLHPTTKPVTLIARLIENSTLPNQLVLDPFLGSGTTLIAAEQTGRVCYGMELAPKYVAVILQRATDAGMTCKREGG